MATLFEEGSSDEDGDLKINKSYAENYNQWREKEEYQKCKYMLIHLIWMTVNLKDRLLCSS